MNIALIFAGGTGIRMNSKTTPKQFLPVFGKTIIQYTLECFQRHEEIDAICIVCIRQWCGFVEALVKKEGLSKVRWVVPGERRPWNHNTLVCRLFPYLVLMIPSYCCTTGFVPSSVLTLFPLVFKAPRILDQPLPLPLR